MILSMILGCVLLGTAGQLLLKEGMNRVGEFSFSTHELMPIAFKVLSSPFVLIGTLCYALSLIVWLLVLSRSEVSYAYPLLSIGYVITAIMGYYLFGDALTPLRIFGIALIILGVIFITR